jgi:uncharacterized protein
MLIVLSPAKSLDFETPIVDVAPTKPEFSADAAALVRRLRELSPREVASLMDLSDALAALNVGRYASYAERGRPPVARAAVLAFDGDVYDGLRARELDADGLGYVQRHLRILSGLYGVLRPLDLMQPYRLEMGTRLATDRGRDLYAWWGDRPAKSLRKALAQSGEPVLVNLASEEYFKVVDRKALGAPVVQPVFQEQRAGSWKVVSFSAKRARGAMTRWAVDQRIEDAQDLKGFDRDGYRFDARASSDDTWVFRRKTPG